MYALTLSNLAPVPQVAELTVQVPSEGAGRSVKCMAVKLPYRGSGGYVGEHQQGQQWQAYFPVKMACCLQARPASLGS